MPANSSNANAVASEKSASPAAANRPSSAYTPTGVRPAGRPSTTSGRWRKASATLRAAARASSSLVVKTLISTAGSDVHRNDDLVAGRCQRERHRTVRWFDLQTPDFTPRRHFGQTRRHVGHQGRDALEY